MASRLYRQALGRARQSQLEMLEERLLLTAAPVILKVSDAVLGGNSFTINGGGFDPATVDVALAAETSSPAFQADFKGSGGGTGGGSDVATSGGTGTLGSGSGWTDTSINTSPFTVGSGNYVNFAVTAGTTGRLYPATFTPTAVGNSWAAMAGSVKIGAYSYLTLNGGFDIFVRPNAISSTYDTWFRPVDVGGGTPFRLIFNGSVTGVLQLQIISTSSVFSNSSTFSTTYTTTMSLTGALGGLVNHFTLGAVRHLGFTFSTNASTGLVTMNAYGVDGTGAIDTTSSTNLLGSQTFYVNGATLLPSQLPSGGWSMAGDAGTATWPTTNVDYESVRLYNKTPGSFAALPYSAPANVATQANFEGTGTGTGPDNIVMQGATGTLGSGTGWADILSSVSPFTAGSGNYLNFAVTAGTTGRLYPATFTPAASGNSWAAMGGSVTIGANTYLTLNGGFDLFVRPNAISSSYDTWFRPVDVGGGSPFRLIFNGSATGGLQLEIITQSNVLSNSSTFATTTNNSWGLTGALSGCAVAAVCR